MKRLSKIVLGCSLLAAAPALADEASAPAPDPAPTTTPPATASAPVAATADGVWGEDIMARPYTLAAKKLSLYGDFNILSIGAGDAGSVSVQTLHVAGAYGVSDKLTVGAEYSVDIHDDGGSFPSDDRAKGPLQLFGTFNLAHSAKLDVGLTGQLVIDLTNLGGGEDSSTSLRLCAQASVRYKVAPKVAVFTGQPQGPGPAGNSIFNVAGIVGNQLIAGLNNDQETGVLIPVGVALQATPQLFLFAETDLAQITLANKPDGADTAVFIGSDTADGGLGIPLAVGGYFGATPTLDVGVTVGFLDLNHAGDFYSIGFGVNYHAM